MKYCMNNLWQKKSWQIKTAKSILKVTRLEETGAHRRLETLETSGDARDVWRTQLQKTMNQDPYILGNVAYEGGKVGCLGTSQV